MSLKPAIYAGCSRVAARREIGLGVGLSPGPRAKGQWLVSSNNVAAPRSGFLCGLCVLSG